MDHEKQLSIAVATLQCTDGVKVVLRGTLRSRTPLTWGIWWLASAAEEDGERGWRFPTVRHESHSPSQAQAEET